MYYEYLNIFQLCQSIYVRAKILIVISHLFNPFLLFGLILHGCLILFSLY